MGLFSGSSDHQLQSWPIVRLKPTGKTYGRSLSVFINNLQCHLTTLDVYQDGSIDCWGFVDRDLFEQKLRTKWVVARPKADQLVSVHGFGATAVEDCNWYQTDRSIAAAVESTLRSLNPSMQGLIDMNGSATEPRGKVQYAKLGLSDKKAYRVKKTTGEEVLADQVPIIWNDGDRLVLSQLLIFSDGVLSRVGSDSCFAVAELRSKYEQGEVTNCAPAGSVVSLPGLGEFRATSTFGGISVEDRIGEVQDKAAVLNGEPSVISVCKQRFAEYEGDKSSGALEALRAAYQAVPRHLRRFCGDMDTRDTAIRAVLGSDAREIL